LEHVYYCFENAESHSFKLINCTVQRFEIAGKEYEGIRRRDSLPYSGNYISEWLDGWCLCAELHRIYRYYLICIGIIFRIFRLRCHRELLREQIVLKI